MLVDSCMAGPPQQCPAGTNLSFVVPETAGGAWTVERQVDAWRLIGHDTSPTWSCLMPSARRGCVSEWSNPAAREHAEIKRDRDVRMVSIIRWN